MMTKVNRCAYGSRVLTRALAALAFVHGHVGCTQLLFDGTRARTEDVASSESSDAAGEASLDTRGKDVNAPETFVDSAASDAAEVDGVIQDARVGTKGPWRFASDDDLVGWSFHSASGKAGCTMERDPAGGGSLKLTLSEPDCELSHAAVGANLHQKQLRMRMMAQDATTEAISANLFAQALATRVEEMSRSVPTYWQPWTMLFDAPGAPAGHDAASLRAYGVTFLGGRSVVWLDDIELVQAPERGSLPAYEIVDSTEDLALSTSGATSSSVTVVRSGWTVAKARISRSGWMTFGLPSRIDLSLAKTMRMRLKVLGAPEVRAFLRLGPKPTVLAARNFDGAYLRDWSELSWDLRPLAGLDLVDEWGISLSGIEGDVELNLDWVRFESTPLTPSEDASVGAEAGSDLSPSNSN